MSNSKAKQTKPGSEIESQPFERRHGLRESGEGTAMGAFYDAFGDLILTPVEISDWSRHGLGLICDAPVATGSKFTLYGDKLPVPHISGTVARCQRVGEKYRVGLQCAERLAA